jgi:hypothetical protein
MLYFYLGYAGHDAVKNQPFMKKLLPDTNLKPKNHLKG